MTNHTPAPWIKGNTAHIVKCVNLHDELVAACKKLLSCMRLANWEGDPSATYARSVLAKAEGNSNV